MDFKLIEFRLLAQKSLIISGHFSQIAKVSGRLFFLSRLSEISAVFG